MHRGGGCLDGVRRELREGEGRRGDDGKMEGNKAGDLVVGGGRGDLIV